MVTMGDGEVGKIRKGDERAQNSNYLRHKSQRDEGTENNQ